MYNKFGTMGYRSYICISERYLFGNNNKNWQNMAKKIIKLTESELENIIEKATLDSLNESGLFRDDELMEYARLRKNNTGLDMDIFVDDGGAYKRYEHPLWIYVRNGYSNTDPVFPIVVSKHPSLPRNISQKKLNIKNIDLKAVLIFVSQNASLLKMFADEEIEHEEFYNKCKPVIYSFSSSSLDEMATLRPKVSGLPTVIWIDEGTDPKHGPRIKFQASKEQSQTRNFTTMTISQNPEIIHPPKKFDLSTKEIERIVQFVQANEENLLLVANGEMTYQDFLKVMVRV